MLKRELKEDENESLAKLFLYYPDRRDVERKENYEIYRKEVKDAFELLKKSVPYARFAKEVYHLCKKSIFKSW